MGNISSIVGPTGSGKTGVVLEAATELLSRDTTRPIAVVSADSRQVYAGIPVITGADIPPGFTNTALEYPLRSSFVHQDIPLTIFGVGIISPLEDWSASHFAELFRAVLTEYSRPDDRIFVVGGTMLYQQSLDRAELLQSPGPKSEIRDRAEQMDLNELQAWLTSIDKSAFERMNESDRSNPRRLVRAIERAVSPPPTASSQEAVIDHEWYGIMPNIEQLADNIAVRVRERFDAGAVEEAEKLRSLIEDKGLNPRKIPAWSACGVQYLDALSQGELTKQQCVEQWAASELRYVKRQLTWWKKQQDITWFSEKQALLEKLLQL